MNTALLMLIAALPQQDFASAEKTYAEVEIGAAAVVQDLAERAEIARERVTVLETRLAAERQQLTELDALEVERYLALKNHFQGEDLETRLQRETRQFDLRRRGLASSIAMTSVDLEDARTRSVQLELDLRLARIEDGLERQPAAAAGTPLADRLEERSRELLWQRGLAAGGFQLRQVPAAWVSRQD